MYVHILYLNEVKQWIVIKVGISLLARIRGYSNCSIQHFHAKFSTDRTTRQSLPQYGCSADGKTCAFAEFSGQSDLLAKATGALFESKTAQIRHNYSINPSTSVGILPQKVLTASTDLTFESKTTQQGSITIPFGSSAQYKYTINIFKQSGSSWIADGFCDKVNISTAVPINRINVYDDCLKTKGAGTYRMGNEFKATATEDLLGGSTTSVDLKNGLNGIYQTRTHLMAMCHLVSGQCF
jgi:hypothetical protein